LQYKVSYLHPNLSNKCQTNSSVYWLTVGRYHLGVPSSVILKDFFDVAKVAIIHWKVEEKLWSSLIRFGQIWLWISYEIQFVWPTFYICSYKLKTKYRNMAIFTIFPPHFWWWKPLKITSFLNFLFKIFLFGKELFVKKWLVPSVPGKWSSFCNFALSLLFSVSC
jgi:hypothetical protein